MGSPLWLSEHPVRRLMHARRAAGGTPGGHGDGQRLGLAIEGGGVRGVVSAGMLCALEDLGFADVFDAVYAASSGAVNAAYFVHRETWFPLNIYFDDLTSPEFLNFRRLLQGEPVMDLDHVFDEVLAHRKFLDYQRILAAPQELHVVVTDVDRIAAVDVHEFTGPEDLRQALRASAWLPLATRGTTGFRGFRAIDGGVVRLHPYRAAVADGCTHVLSLSTKPIRLQRSAPGVGSRYVARHLDRMRPGLGRAYAAGVTEYHRVDRPLLNAARADLDRTPSILDVAPPPGTPEVRRLERRLPPIMAGAATGMRVLHEAITGRHIQVATRLMPVFGADAPTRSAEHEPTNGG